VALKKNASAAPSWCVRHRTDHERTRAGIEFDCPPMNAPPYVTAYLGYAYGAAGDRAPTWAQIEALDKKSLNGYLTPFNVAIAYLRLGCRERALLGLEQASAAHPQ
jgi:hypothetical protein